MPEQVQPIQELARVGLIEDTPSVLLPPNGFSDVNNVRFHSNAIRKFPAETSAWSGTAPTLSSIVYVAHWSSTEGPLTVVVTDNGTDSVVAAYLPSGQPFTIGGTPLSETLTGVTGGEWQHTVFNGGYHLILNNGNSTPVYLQADTADVVELPGWASYAAEETVMDFEFDGAAGGTIVVNTALEEGTRIKITSVPRNTSIPIRSDTVNVNAAMTGVTPDGNLAEIGTITLVSATGFTFTPAADTGGNRYIITTVSEPVSTVTASVIRAYGNLLVAGNLIERDGRTNPIRTLTGTIRTSDVAGPGQIPTNWNPFQLGVNTADEFILASTGVIQDMAELQGVMYIYTDSSIHAIQQTGSPTLPFQVTTVTNNFGADNVDSVIEFDGKHIVVGNDDVYIFAGHPGSISSIADGRVRHNFRGNTGWKIVRLNSWDELWFYKPSVNEVYIWNYRGDTWTKRNSGNTPVSINSAPSELLLATSSTIMNVNSSTSYLDNTFVERRRLAMAPEFDTEYLSSIALLMEGGDTLAIEVVGTNAPGDLTQAFVDMGTFNLTEDYKHDIRQNGRFLNYRFEHDFTSEMVFSGFQLEFSKGGTR